MPFSILLDNCHELIFHGRSLSKSLATGQHFTRLLVTAAAVAHSLRFTSVLLSATLWPGGCFLTVKSSISLTDEQHAFAKALVDTGRYSSVSAVIQQGIHLLRRRLDVEDLERRAL